jgi:hypothetical protein
LTLNVFTHHQETDGPSVGPQKDELDWTLVMVDKDQSSSGQASQAGPSAPPVPAQSQPATASAATASATDQDVQMEADKFSEMHISNHPDSRVATALNYMRAMGYEDEGGWLTHLLEAKNGDINRALDAIKFGQHHK